MIQAEVDDLLSSGAIRLAHPGEPLLYQRLFLVDKKEGTKRPVLDCRSLNKHLDPPHFKLEGFSEVRSTLRRGDYLTKVDLKSAYLHIPMAESATRYLAFQWEGRDYVFESLPFGVSTAPWIFSKIMRTVVTELRMQGIRVVIYLDDLLIMGSSLAETETATRRVLQLLGELGFRVGWKKCVLTPTQSITFLGLQIDSIRMSISLPGDRRRALRATVEKAIQDRHSWWSARRIAHVVGKLVATRPAVRPTYLHLVHLNLAKDLARRRGSWASCLRLPPKAVAELRWWRSTLSAEPPPETPVTEPEPTWVLTTDSSLDGYGATLQGPDGTYQETRGFWPHNRYQHINTLELAAGLMALRSFAKWTSGQPIRWRCDNTPTVFSVRKWKTRNLETLAVLQSLWDTVTQQKVTLTVEHTPGVLNERADWLSRVRDREDWKLNPALFRRVCHGLNFSPTVDAFATNLNRQVTRFWSRYPEPEATAVDAFAQEWAKEKAWANPPYSMVGKVLSLLDRQQATALLILPQWPSQAWWPQLLKRLVKAPILLPNRKDTFLPGKGGSMIPAGKPGWRAMACLVSGDPRKRKLRGPSVKPRILGR